MQMKVWGWTNPSTAVVRNENIGFTVDNIIVTNVTVGKQYNWNSSMTDDYYVTIDTGAVTTSNGFTPLAQSTSVGATVSGFTNANPGVITVNDTTTFGFAAGDTIKVCNLVDDSSGDESLNNTFTVASVTATAITLVENTSTTGYSVYVSGGTVIRVKDASGAPIAQENKAILGITLGSGVVGGDNDVMTAVAYGSNCVV